MVLLFIEHYVLIVFCQLHALSHFGGDYDDVKQSEERKSDKIDAIRKTFHAIDLNDYDLQEFQYFSNQSFFNRTSTFSGCITLDP